MLFILKNANQIVWGAPMLVILLGTHVFFTVRLRFVQKHVFRGIRLSLSPRGENANGISGFAALTTTLAATLGTGNIIGLSTAIALGGPGALLWCWLTGILGMATTYGECYLSVIHQNKTKPPNHGGPMHVLGGALHNKPMAYVYAGCLLLSCFGIGCLTQSGAIVSSTKEAWRLPPPAVGACVAVLVGLVVIGGIRSISRLCMRLMPALSLFFALGLFLLLIQNHRYIPASIALILKNAFSPSSMGTGVAVGGLQTAIRYGVARGLFTNEAGLGTAAVFAASSAEDPGKQALISMTATFWDTVVLCALTGIAITSHFLNQSVAMDQYPIGGLTAAAFSSLPFGESLLTAALIGFALSTLIGWSYLGEQAFVYLFGRSFLSSYHLIYVCMVFFGAVLSLELVWELTDFFNALLVFPNLYALYRLRKHIAKP